MVKRCNKVNVVELCQILNYIISSVKRSFPNIVQSEQFFFIFCLQLFSLSQDSGLDISSSTRLLLVLHILYVNIYLSLHSAQRTQLSWIREQKIQSTSFDQQSPTQFCDKRLPSFLNFSCLLALCFPLTLVSSYFFLGYFILFMYTICLYVIYSLICISREVHRVSMVLVRQELPRKKEELISTLEIFVLKFTL